MFARIRALAAFTAILLHAAGAATQPASPLRGFTAQGSAAERAAEEKFRAVPKPENAREYMQTITADAASRRQPGEPQGRRVHPRAVQVVGPRRVDRDVRGADAIPDRAPRRDGGARALRR